MLGFKKENGFPMTIKIETSDYEEVMEDNEVWKGYESIVTDEDGNEIDRFTHKDLFSRFMWVNGFFSGIKHLEPWRIDSFNDPDHKWKGPETPIEDENGSNLEVGDWIVTKGGDIRKIKSDDQEDLPFKIIERFATRLEAKNADKIKT